jgi:glycosyltransferase involved in cell wall biosynthesis
MNIIILNDFAYIDGGASKIALGSARALAKIGHRVTLFTAVGPIDPSLLGLDNLEVLCLDQDEIISDPNRMRAAVRGLWNWHAQERFSKCLKANQPSNTVVHLHTWTKALSASVIRSATGLGFPVVLTLHDYFSVCPTGSFFIHPSQKICTLKPMSWSCIRENCDSRSYSHKLWRVGRHWVQDHFGHLPSHILDYIVISTLSEKIIAPLLPTAGRLHRVANFIDMTKRPVTDVAANEAFSFVGRLSPEKGPRLLAECARKLKLTVSFIGDGPLKPELAAIAPSALFTGWISPESARTEMQKSRALVFPSLWYETQGLVVAEAAALGIPVIVPSTSAACEWVDDGVTGLIFRGGDAMDLAEKIILLRDNPDIAAAMGQEAYLRYWRRPATLERHCDDLEHVYQQLLSSDRQVNQAKSR